MVTWHAPLLKSSWREGSEISAHVSSFHSEFTWEKGCWVHFTEEKTESDSYTVSDKGCISSPLFSPDEMNDQRGPQKGRKGRNRGSAAFTEVFCLRKLGKLRQFVSFQEQKECIRLKCMFVFVVFLKHQLVELPPYPQLTVSLSPHWKKRAEIPAPLGTSWFVLCIFISAATRPSPLYLRGSVGCISSPGFWEPVWFRRAVTNRLGYFLLALAL